MKNKKGQTKRPTPNHPWIRRLVRLGICVLAILVILRITLWLSLPWLVNRSAQRVGLQCVYEELNLSLLTGDMELWHLQLWPADSNESLLDMEYCRANVSIKSLLTRQLIVDRVEVDGIDISITRNKDGSFEGLDGLLPLTQTQQEAQTDQAVTSTSGPNLSLEVPFRTRALRLQHVQVHFKDQSITPPVDTLLDMTFRLSDLGYSQRQTRFQLTMACQPILNQCVVEGTVQAAPNSLITDFSCQVRGFHAAPLAGYTHPIGIDAASDTISAGFQGSLALTTSEPSSVDANTSNAVGAQQLKAHIALTGAFLKADNQKILGLNQLIVNATMPNQHTVTINRVDCAQGDLHLWLREHDVIELAGLRIQQPTRTTPAVSGPTQPTIPMTWCLNQLSVEALNLHLHDTLATPATDSTVTLEQFTLGDLRRDLTGKYTQTQIQAQLSAPGIFRSAQLEGKADLMSHEKHLDASFSIEGFAPTGLDAYLNQLGLESHHTDTDFSGHVQADLAGPRQDGSFRVDANIANLRIQDPNELFGLDRIAIDQLDINPLTQQLHVSAIDISGQRLRVQRKKDKSYSMLGFTIRPAAPSPSPTPHGTRGPAVDPIQVSPEAASSGRITIDRFSWQNNTIELIDHATSSDLPTVIPLTYGLDINDVAWGLLGPSASQPVAKLHFWCKAPGIAGSIQLSGSVTPQRPGIGFDVTLAGQNLDGQKLTPYLEPFGIEPLFAKAKLKASLKGQVSPRTSGLEASFSVNQMLFGEPNQTWFQVHSIDVKEMILEGPTVTIKDVQIHTPILSVAKDVNHALVTSGFRFRPKETRATWAIKPITLPVQLNQLALDQGQLHWEDHTVRPPVDLNLQYSGSLEQVSLNEMDEPAQLTLQLTIPSVLESLQISGQGAIRTDHIGANLKIEGKGIDLTPMAPYFKAPVLPHLTDGQFTASLNTTVNTHETTQQADVLLEDLALYDSKQAAPLIRLDQAIAKVKITEPNTLTLNELSVKGLEALAQKNKTGDLKLLGMVFTQTTPSAATTAPKTSATNTDTSTLPTTAKTRRSSTKLPTVILESVDLNIAGLTYQDLSRAKSMPIVAQNIRLRNTTPSRVLCDALETAEPLNLELSGGISPLIDSFTMSTQLTPFAPEPMALVDLDIQGIHGNGLTAINPELAALIDGTELEDGHLRGKLLAALRLPRRTLLDFDPNQAFELTLQLTDLALSDQNQPDLLAGLKEMHAELPMIHLGKKEIHIKRLEMTEPQCQVRKTAKGLHVMNMLFKLPDANATAQTSDVVAQVSNPPEPAQPLDPRSPFNVRLDQFVASGLDFTLTDDTIEPALVIPLTGMDVELRGLATQPDNKPIHLNAIVSAGKVSLPRRKRKATSKDPNPAVASSHEAIRLFQEITVTGRVTPGLQPTGWIKAGLSGLELRHMAAAAKPSGLAIEDGVLDASVDVRLKGNGKSRFKTRMILSDLKLSESDDGPLTKHLKLPAPLETTLFILRGPDGTIRLPLDFTVTDKGVSSGQIATAALGSASSVIAKAVAGSPLRAINTVGRLFGTGQDEEMGPPEETVLSYAGGALELSRGGQATLDSLIEKIKTDPHAQMTIQHQLGSADLHYAEQLVNPSRPESLDLLNQLKQRKQHLLTQRTHLLVQIQAAYTTAGSTQILTLTGKLRSVGRQIGLIETAMDGLLDTLRSGARHAKRRRTREGSIAIAQARLSALNDRLARNQIKDYERRIRIAAPSFARADENNEGRITIFMVKTKVK